MKNDPDPLQEPRFEKLLAELRAQPVPEPSADFTGRTLARARRSSPRRRSVWLYLPRIAAALALLGAAGLWLARGPAPVARAPAPVDILMAAQRDDGGWSADDQNRRARYDTSVTALALLALLKSGDAPLQGTQAAAIRAGVDHLLRQQQADGRFGGDFSGADFTQYLAGYVGPSVVHRGSSPQGEAVWTLAEVQNLLDLWIVAVWQNKPHAGLRHPAMPKKDLTPNEAYAALASVAPTASVALDRDDYIGLLPVRNTGAATHRRPALNT